MRILSIETSCDETGVSVLECSGDTAGATFRVLGNALYSQAHLHAPYGGVYPTLAKREHQKNLPLLYEQAMQDAGAPSIDLIAVTQGPGLEPALWQGIEFAKGRAERLGAPVIGIDHMEGHIVSGLVHMTSNVVYEMAQPQFPVLALLISGGHTELLLMREWFTYELIGRTKDDAIGEAFDKVARMLGLEYPGGPKIERLAAQARARNAVHDIVFPRPMAHDNTCDFSFSGLKTAVLYKLRSLPEGTLAEETKENIADAFQNAARDVLVMKTRRALFETQAKTLAVGGGVSASQDIRAALEAMVESEFPETLVAYPAGTLHLDNAIMIGMAGYLRHVSGKAVSGTLEAEGSRSLTEPLP